MLHYKEVKEGIKALLIGMSNGQRLPGRLQLMKLLDASREYWNQHGVEDWGLVIDAEE